jgi:CobQ-like glutamine amidotransferase family enzyme
MQLRLLTLYPERMNIYADRGNALFLKRRCEWRGIEFEESGATIGDRIDPEAHDLIYIGGGQDADQRAVAEDMLTTKKVALATATSRGVPLLAVCGGYQLLGESYALEGETLPGLGLADLATVRTPGPRLVGNVIIESALEPHPSVGEVPRGPEGGPLIVGFENHGGRTQLGDSATALGQVIQGHGNNGEDGLEGVIAGSVIGTYLHGPLLPKNWWLADHLIATALERRYGEAPWFEELDDELERAANAQALTLARGES